MIFFDLETFKIVDGLLAPPLVVGSFCTSTGPAWLLEPDRAATAVEYAIQNEEVIVGLNCSFDLAVIAEHRPHLLVPIWNHYRKGLVRCVVVRQKLLDIASGQLKFHDDEDGKTIKSEYSMKALAKRFLDLEIAKGEETWRLRYGELYGIPLDEWPTDARQYSLDDATITRDLFLSQNNGLPITNEKEQTVAAWALHLMSCWGMRVDGDMLSRVKADLAKKRTDGRQALIDTGFFKPVALTPKDIAEGAEVEFYGEYKAKNKAGQKRPFRWGKDTKKIKARVEKQFTRRGAPVPKTDKGATSTEKDVLERSGSFLLQKLADLGAIDKILQTYVPAMEVGAHVPINPGLNVLVNTGRTSSFKPNIQNMPTGRREGQDIRPAFIPRPGYVFCSIDYATLELRALAHWCEVHFGFSKMADVLREGKDLHLAMAANMLDIPYAEAEVRKEQKEPVVARHRDLAKPANFGFPGGMSARTLVDYARKSYGVVMDEETAFRLKDQFMQDWPEMELYFRLHAALPGLDHGEASYEQMYSGRVRGGMSFCDSCNGRFQGLSADGFKAALVEVSYEAYCVEDSPLYGCRPVAPIHDEILSEMPEDRYEQAVARKDEIMKREMGRYMPGIPVETSPAVMCRWYKKAEAVYETDASGNKRLIPWEPSPKAA